MTECVTTRGSNRESAREQPIMARHQRMPSEEAGYTYAVEPAAVDRLLANEGESIYSHWSSIIPKKSKLVGIGQMLKFYIRMGKAPLPNWYAHNPLWQPLYLIILPVLLGVCITGMMHDSFAQQHASLAAVISLFTLFHVFTAFLHDWKGKGAMISAMINGYRYFHNESPVQNSIDRGSDINISVDSIGRIKSNDE